MLNNIESNHKNTGIINIRLVSISDNCSLFLRNILKIDLPPIVLEN